MTTALAPAYSQPSVYGGPAGRVHHGYSTAQTDLVNAGQEVGTLQGPRLVTNAWYAKLEPGGFIVPHIDQGPWLERWHYPQSGQGFVWQEWAVDHWRSGIAEVAVPENPYRMNHHRPHAVWNPHNEPRVVLIVEYDNPIDQPTTDLIIEPMIPQIQEMIDALR